MTKHLLLAALALVALPSSATGSEHTDDRALLVILNGREFPGADLHFFAALRAELRIF